MPANSGIYGLAKQVEMPSMLDAQQKASTLSSMALQQKRAGQEIEGANLDAHLKKASAFGSTLEGLSGLSEEERAAAWPKVIQEHVQAGILAPDQMPAEYDSGLYRQSLMRARQLTPMIEDRLKKAQTSKLYAEAAEDKNKTQNLAKQQFDMLPVENQEQIKDLAKKTSSKESIANQLQATFETLQNKDVPYEQKLMAAKNLGKVLNSTEGADAVGEGEAKRMMAFLNYLPTDRPGFDLGPQIDKFTEQVGIKLGDIRQAAAMNKQGIDKLYGRQPSELAPRQYAKSADGKDQKKSGFTMAADLPKHGDVQDGYVFLGGNPSDPKSWKRAK